MLSVDARWLDSSLNRLMWKIYFTSSLSVLELGFVLQCCESLWKNNNSTLSFTKLSWKQNNSLFMKEKEIRLKTLLGFWLSTDKNVHRRSSSDFNHATSAFNKSFSESTRANDLIIITFSLSLRTFFTPSTKIFFPLFCRDRPNRLNHSNSQWQRTANELRKNSTSCKHSITSKFCRNYKCPWKTLKLNLIWDFCHIHNFSWKV